MRVQVAQLAIPYVLPTVSCRKTHRYFRRSIPVHLWYPTEAFYMYARMKAQCEGFIDCLSRRTIDLYRQNLLIAV